MRIDIMTLFPDTVGDMMNESILGRAQERGLIRIEAWQIRDYTTNKQNQVDDYPYGGGRGAVMQADPLYNCWQAICDEVGAPVHTIYMSPCGVTFDQSHARRLRDSYENIILVCGHYEASTSVLLMNAWTKRSPSAILCSPAASCRPCALPTLYAVWFPAFWATKNALPMKATGPVRWNIPNTPAPNSGTAWLRPRFSCPATTRV